MSLIDESAVAIPTLVRMVMSRPPIELFRLIAPHVVLPSGGKLDLQLRPWTEPD